MTNVMQNTEYRNVSRGIYAVLPVSNQRSAISDQRSARSGSSSLLPTPDSRLPTGEARLAARDAFTLIELLVVISIIALLLGLLLPAILWAQKQAYITATEADMHALSIGLDQYHADFGMYPNSSIVASTGAYPTTPGGTTYTILQGHGYDVMAEALLGYLPGALDGAPASTTGNPTPNGSSTTGTWTLNQTQGFTMAPYKKVYGPYVGVTATNIYMVPGSPTASPPTYTQYYFTDAFGQAATTSPQLMPILYFSANTNPFGATAGTTTYIFGDSASSGGSGSPPQQGIFNYADDWAPGSTLPMTFPVKNVDSSGTVIPGFFNLIGDPLQDNTVDAGVKIMGSDGYLLVSAGPDGAYFNPPPSTGSAVDDIVYGQ